MLLTLPDGSGRDVPSERMDLIRNAFRAGKFPPAPEGWEQVAWEAGCLLAIDPPPVAVEPTRAEPKAPSEFHPMLADRLLDTCDRLTGDWWAPAGGRDPATGKTLELTGTGPHPWGCGASTSEPAKTGGPRGWKRCKCSQTRSTLESVVRIHPALDGCRRLLAEDTPLVRQVGRMTVVRTATTAIWWSHFRALLMRESRNEPHTEWRFLIDSDLREASRPKNWRRDDDDTGSFDSASDDDSMYEAVISPRHLVLMPTEKPGKRSADYLLEGLKLRVGKGRPVWFLLPSGWETCSQGVRDLVSPFETVVLD